MNEHITNEINIDSLLLRIPLKYITIKDSKLSDYHNEYVVNETTGEFQPKKHRFKPAEHQKLTVNKIGYDYQFHIKAGINQKTGGKIYYLFMLVNAKMLESKYFEGVTINNIKNIYEGLINCNIVHFTFNDLLFKSQCTGVEFCKNFRISNLRGELIKLKDKIVKTPKRNPIPKITKNSKEDSLRFIDKKKATNAKPHLFIYNKEKELVSNSYPFMNQHLNNQNITNLCRVEYRIKDRKHAKHLGIENTNLNTLLNLTNDFKCELLNKLTNSYLEQPQSIQATKLTPNKVILLNALRGLTSHGNNFGIAAEILLEGVKPASRKSEKHKELKELYYAHIYQPTKLAKNRVQIYDILELYKPHENLI